MISHGNVSLEWLDSPDAVLGLEDEWRELESDVVDRTVHSRFDWVYPWYRHMMREPSGKYGEVRLGIARDGDDLVGLAPFVRRNIAFARVPLVAADPVGVNAETGEFLVRAGYENLKTEFVDSLFENHNIDMLRLIGAGPKGDVLEPIQDAASAARRRFESVHSYYPVVEFGDGYEAYYASRSNRYRRSLRRQEEQIRELYGEWSIDRIANGAGTAGLERNLKRMRDVYNRSWKVIGSSELSDHFFDFYSELAGRFAARNTLDFSILKFGEEDAAFFLALRDDDVLYDVFISFADRFRDVRPGEFLMKQLFPIVADDGVRTIVSHGPHAYKKVWSSAERAHPHTFIFGNTIRGRLAWATSFRMKPLAEKLSKKLANTGLRKRVKNS